VHSQKGNECALLGWPACQLTPLTRLTWVKGWAARPPHNRSIPTAWERTMRTALNVIRDEHRSLTVVLHGLWYLVDEVREGRRKPDFTVLRAMMHYIDTFPEKLHHPKENRYLFARLRRRTSTANVALDQLEAEHFHGAKLVRDLEQALLHWELGGQQDLDAFAEEVERYVDFHRRHMQQEEEVVLPLAERVLTEEDWREIDAAFAGNADPLIAKDVEKNFERLFKHIVNIAPPPLGFGRDN
jgi:hemerythrin-like domain-containing protein